MKKGLKLFIICIVIAILALHLIRSINPPEIDDVHPNRFCEQEYIEKSEVLWVMPLYQNISIAENKTWCEKILSLNKTIGMHGITHEYHEFAKKINETQFILAKQDFTTCFGYQPTIFKPPYLRLSQENRKLLKKHNFTIKNHINQNTRKVYHCSDSGTLPNSFHDVF